MVDKKNNSGIVLLIVILIFIILGLIAFIIYDKVLFVYDENKTENTTSIKVIEETNNNDNEEIILRRDNFVYKLNDKDFSISYVYKFMDSSEFYNDENIDEENLKEYNDYVYNMVYLEILLNEKKLDIEKIPIYYDFENLSDKDLINRVSLISSDTINTLKSSDSEYLVFTIEHAHQYVDGGVNPFIVNAEGQVIHTIEFQDNTGWWTTDENSLMYDKGKYFITNDTLYYLMPTCEQPYDKGLYFEQYSLKVENNKVIIENQGTYKGEAAGGAVCGG